MWKPGACSYAGAMTLAEELERIATLAGADAVLAAEAQPGERIYVCAFEEGDGGRTWLALDHDGDAGRGAAAHPRRRLDPRALRAGRGDRRRAATSTSSAPARGAPRDREPARDRGGRGGGAGAPARDRCPPTLATPGRLDEIGAATRTLEIALGGAAQGSPFAAAMKGASEVVEALFADVERSYRIPLR